MKKSTLLLLCILLSQFLLSQTVLTNDLNFNIGDNYRYDGYSEVTNIEPGPAGANKFWNFSNVTGITFIDGTNNICVDPATTAFGDSSAVASANICIRNQDNPSLGPCQYFDCNNSKQELLAMGFLMSNNSSFSTYINKLTSIEFPFAYGDTFTDEWEVMGYHIDFGYFFMRDSAMVTVEADAYGTITTPTGEFEDVLRIKRTTIHNSWYRYGAGQPWVFIGEFTDIDYEWYAPGIKIPVMLVRDMDGFESYTISYLVEYNFPTVITEEEEYNFEIIPNPSSNIINISSQTPMNKIELYSLNGQKISLPNSKLINSQKHSINLFDFPIGIYLVEVEFSNGQISHQRIIKQ